MSKPKNARRPDEAPTTHTDADTLVELSAEMAEVASRVWGLQQPDTVFLAGQEKIAQLNGRILSDATALAERFVAFGSQRFCADMACAARLAHCQTPADLLNLQQNWLETAMHDYRKCSEDLYGAGTRLFMDSMKAAAELTAGMMRHDTDRGS